MKIEGRVLGLARAASFALALFGFSLAGHAQVAPAVTVSWTDAPASSLTLGETITSAIVLRAPCAGVVGVVKPNSANGFISGTCTTPPAQSAYAVLFAFPSGTVGKCTPVAPATGCILDSTVVLGMTYSYEIEDVAACSVACTLAMPDSAPSAPISVFLLAPSTAVQAPPSPTNLTVGP